VDAELTVVATLKALAGKGQLDCSLVAKAVKDLGVDAEKAYPANSGNLGNGMWGLM
jgi:pyruvate dehydrogenase complex dehydrogenase (E1) component